MNKLAISAYLDGRPGHEKQTLAVIGALERLTPVSVKTVAAGTEAAGGLMGAIPAALLLTWRPQRAAAGSAEQLLIGSGRRTHPDLIRAKYRLGRRAAAVCSMSPGPLFRPALDLCLVPDHDAIAAGDNILLTHGPPCLPVNEGRHDPGRSLILIGGLDPKSHHWDSEEICRQVATLIKQHPEREWTISSSPRTPEETVSRLAALAAAVPGRAAFHRAEETPQGWVEEQYRLNREAWVSADSISMVYEALSAGCRVGVLPVRWRRPDNKFQRGLDYLEQRNLIVYLEDWLTGTPWPSGALVFNEAERCAREILRRWWPERL